ncbi:hypothetical protein [Pseudoalteromonas sp.]|uniref:hypothetical protein n=1 Tax=Pseudoalteromonas sp. TaxID=53249 RepID=UPI0023546DB4|nr:hypothetical protein [Pseudoalteromonas sp.]
MKLSIKKSLLITLVVGTSLSNCKATSPNNNKNQQRDIYLEIASLVQELKETHEEELKVQRGRAKDKIQKIKIQKIKLRESKAKTNTQEIKLKLESQNKVQLHEKVTRCIKRERRRQKYVLERIVPLLPKDGRKTIRKLQREAKKEHPSSSDEDDSKAKSNNNQGKKTSQKKPRSGPKGKSK